jgi:hypothetical protein
VHGLATHLLLGCALSQGGAEDPPDFSFVTAPGSSPQDSVSLANSFISVNVDPHFRQPYLNEWDFDIQSQLVPRVALEVRYLGTAAAEMSHFPFFGNQTIPGPGANQPRRLYPDFGLTAASSSGANANYNSLQVQLTKKLVTP